MSQPIQLLYEEFLKVYELEDKINMDDSKTELKPEDERVCRFCNQTTKEGKTFKSEAHKIPCLLGKHDILSDSECDQCNSKIFSRYENDLKNYLGITPTLNGVKGRRGTTSYQDRNVLACNTKLPEDRKGIFVLERFNEQLVDFTSGNMEGKITINNNSYNKLYVYKALSKIGLGSLPDKYLSEYTEAFNLLKEDSLPNVNNAKIVHNRLPLHMNLSDEPYMMIFKRKNPTARVPYHVFFLYFQNTIIQFSLTGHSSDTTMMNDGQIFAMLTPPPILTPALYNQDFNIQVNIVNLESNEVEKEHTELIHFKFEKPAAGSIKNNPEIGEFEDVEDTNFQNNTYTGVVLIPRGSRFTAEQARVLSDEIKKRRVKK